ncbi:MAG: glutaconyl-CoA decarboxylase subunit alpha, partial [Oscillospiraceae bacterium]|nr:glutaconyl-CoA decarboxylase subunit alpha [Oscillospiraceae bacterium]
LGCLLDGSEFLEFKADYGPEIVAGLAKVNGLLCGVIANYQGMIQNYPEYLENSVGVGGKLYRQGLIKMSEFVTLCARDRIPLVWVQDTTGIDVGDPAEKAELLGLGQSLIFSIENAKIPQMEITLRKGTAAAHYVIGGPQGNNTNVFSLGTAATEIYVMHGETAAAAMYARRLVKDQDAGKDIQPIIDKMNDLIKKYHDKSRPDYCAKVGFVDEIVELDGLRNYICAFVGAAYQNPKSLCAFHQMLTPRVIRDWDASRN